MYALLIIGFLLIAYGLVILSIGSGTKFFLVWIVAGIGFLLLAAIQKKIGFHSIPAGLRKCFVAGIALAAVILVATIGLIFTHFSDSGNPNCKYVIVLGAQVRETGPSKVLRNRLDTAADFLNQNPDTRCIVSGGQGWNEPTSEAAAMRDYLMDKGIEKGRIILEDRSTNTNENLQYSLKLMENPEDAACIVTNNFHMYRALKLAKSAGFQEASGLAAPSATFYLPNNILRECLGVWKDLLVGNFS